MAGIVAERWGRYEQSGFGEEPNGKKTPRVAENKMARRNGKRPCEDLTWQDGSLRTKKISPRWREFCFITYVNNIIDGGENY